MRDYACEHCDGTGQSQEMMSDGFELEVACPKCNGDGFIGTWERLDKELWEMAKDLTSQNAV